MNLKHFATGNERVCTAGVWAVIMENSGWHDRKSLVKVDKQHSSASASA